MKPMHVRLAVLSAAVFVSGAAALAQGPPPMGPVAEAKRAYEGVKKNILASADKMPADSYSFKPVDTPDLRTFARVLTHVTEAQFHSCGAFNGTDQKTLVTPDQTADKATIVAALQKSFMECDKAYAAATDATLTDMVQAGPAKRTKITILWGTNSHDAEQYATLALYLRIKGIQPPSAEK